MPNWCYNKYVFYTDDENKGDGTVASIHEFAAA